MICTLCISRKVKKSYRIENFQCYKSYSCGLIFLHPRPNKRKIHASNELKYNVRELEINYVNRKDEFIRRAYRCIRSLDKLRSKSSILDIGCGFGFYLYAFKQLGFKAIGIDTVTQPVHYGRKILKLKIIKDNFLDYNFKKRKI